MQRQKKLRYVHFSDGKRRPKLQNSSLSHVSSGERELVSFCSKLGLKLCAQAQYKHTSQEITPYAH
jgi:hypothetical protein